MKQTNTQGSKELGVQGEPLHSYSELCFCFVLFSAEATCRLVKSDQPATRNWDKEVRHLPSSRAQQELKELLGIITDSCPLLPALLHETALRIQGFYSLRIVLEREVRVTISLTLPKTCLML